MAEILSLVKIIKLFLSFTCYFGTGMAVMAIQIPDSIRDTFKITPTLEKFIFWMFIIFWIIKIVWFVVDKIIQVKERLQDMRKKGKMENNK